MMDHPIETALESDTEQLAPGESRMITDFDTGPPGVGPVTGIGSGTFFPSPDLASESASSATL